MKLLIAPDKFKTTLSSAEVISALKKGILHTNPDIEIEVRRVSDGGEGFLDAIEGYLTGFKNSININDPLGRKTTGTVFYLPQNRQAYIESCQANGFHLISAKERNPLKTTSTGVGELIQEALKLEVSQIFIGLGSSATCDGGLGMATSLGFQFLDRNGTRLDPIAENLISIAKIVPPHDVNRFKNIHFYGLCDVSNPPVGKNGGVKVYSPQKGASVQQVEELEKGMNHYVEQLEYFTGRSLKDLVGGGAAGCLGLALNSFLKAELVSGADFIIDMLNLEKSIQETDVLITGEGSFDEQSLAGKIPHKLLQLAQKYHKRVILVTGKSCSNVEEFCSDNYSIEALIDSAKIANIAESAKGMFNIGQMIGATLQK